MFKLHSILARQLKQLGFAIDTVPVTDLLQWQDLLIKISKAYEEADQNFYTVERTLQISSKEMALLNDELTEKRNKLQAVMSEGLCFIAKDWTIESLNLEAERLLKCKSAQLIGRKFYDCINIYDISFSSSIDEARVMALAEKGTAYKQDDAYIYEYQGNRFPAAFAINFIITDSGFFGAILVFRDITHQKMAEQALLERTVQAEQLVQEHVEKLHQSIDELKNKSVELAYQETHDFLTGLINRTEFEKKLDFFIKPTYAGEAEHVLIYMDLDQFKIINDDCGHLAGDGLLQEIANVLSVSLRKWDIVARLGGDEFGILLLYCTSEQAIKIANQIKDRVQNLKFEWQGSIYPITVSIGIVPINKRALKLEATLKNADTACYVAKDAGRNRIHVFHEYDESSNKRYRELKRLSDINNALEQNRFKLFYQIIAPIEQSENDLLHFEILLRMIDINGKIILPNEFLPAAERYNLINKIDRWVIKESFSQLNQHSHKLDSIELCSINLSGQSLSDDDMCNYVSKLLAEYNIPPTKICFEVTETAAIANFEKAVYFMTELKQLGCKFALDDFGSGLSSFAYLKKLPIDYLKIDGLFIRDIASTEMDYAMVKSINEIGHVMGKMTIAEFVESDAILQRLKDIGVNYVQGYNIARPKPLDGILH